MLRAWRSSWRLRVSRCAGSAVLGARFTRLCLWPTADAGEFDTLLHAGDFAYDLDTDVGRVGDGYMRQLQPIIAQIPYNGIPGNHESANNFTHYKTRFASIAEVAGKQSGSGTNMYYSVVDGLTHFIFWVSRRRSSCLAAAAPRPPRLLLSLLLRRTLRPSGRSPPTRRRRW